MLVKYDCGCIGLPRFKDGTVMVLEDCTRTHVDERFSFSSSPMRSYKQGGLHPGPNNNLQTYHFKKSEPLSEDEVVAIFKAIGKLVHDGESLRKVRLLLNKQGD